jgi:hypothetical protein
VLNRWRDEAVRSGHKISRIAVAFEAGRDGFWLARWLNARASRTGDAVKGSLPNEEAHHANVGIARLGSGAPVMSLFPPRSVWLR